MNRRPRNGFTLVELLVVTVLGAFIVLAIYQVLITNTRTYAINNAQIQGQQALRAGLDVLVGELREVSVGQGDILSISHDAILIRTPRAVGLVCATNYGATPAQVTALRVGKVIQEDDSIVILAANELNTTQDDVWLARVVRSSDTTATCGTLPGQTLQVPDLAITGDTVRMGAPIRAFDTYEYGLYEIDGRHYLGRRQAGARSPDPLVGPLCPDSGLAFRYLDSSGAVTASTAAVAQIEIALRFRSQVRDNQGQFVADSLVARVCPRN